MQRKYSYFIALQCTKSKCQGVETLIENISIKLLSENRINYLSKSFTNVRKLSVKETHSQKPNKSEDKKDSFQSRKAKMR